MDAFKEHSAEQQSDKDMVDQMLPTVDSEEITTIGELFRHCIIPCTVCTCMTTCILIIFICISYRALSCRGKTRVTK